MEEGGIKLGIFLAGEGPFPSTTIVVGVTYPCNWFVLNKLINGQPCSCLELAYASENTCVLYSIFEDVREALIGTPVARYTYKVSTISCNYQNGEFLISINCPNDFDVVESIVLEVAPRLVPLPLENRYAYNIRLLNGVPNGLEFLYIVNGLSQAEINFVIGGVNSTKEVMDQLLYRVLDMVTDPSPRGGGVPPQSLAKKQGVTDYPTVEAEGKKAFYVDAFIRHTLGVSTAIHSGTVIIYDKEWKKIATQITKKNIDDYVTKTCGAGVEYISTIIVFAALIECSLDSASLRGMCVDAPTADTIGGYIKSALLS